MSSSSTNSEWKVAVRKEWEERESKKKKQNFQFPIAFASYGIDEILGMSDTLLDGRLTMGPKVEEFEKKFAEFVGSPYAVFCNSGSSANLLAVACACEQYRKSGNGILKPGDEVLVASVTWITSITTLIQYGLSPIFVDVNPKTLNLSLDAIKAAYFKNKKKIRAILLVHVMGNCGCDEGMEALMEFVKENNLILIEDSCEALGGKSFNSSTNLLQSVGTWGDFGTFSFYFSHHLCTGEGGMVLCKNLRDYDLLRSIRAHGWTRLHSEEFKHEMEEEAKTIDLIDDRFLFAHLGYNLRPLEIQATMGLIQLSKISTFNQNRNKAFEILKQKISQHPNFNNQLSFTEVGIPDVFEPCWFSFPMLLSDEFQDKRNKFLDYLTAHGVENRSILSGNFLRQPVFKNYIAKKQGITDISSSFVGSDKVHFCGFYIGLGDLDVIKEDVLEECAKTIMGFFSMEEM